jgi:MoaA/NifB/PqqE/SkfB family radical SAM enzyme
MPKLKTSRKLAIAARAAKNIVVGRPITASFEITFNCNADCKHCNWGPYVKEPRLGPGVWADWLVELKPTVVQISGGEPLLRKDVYDIIAEMRRHDQLAVFVLTTNAQLLNEEKYLKLREAGIEEFSISLDYPDERHNEFRKLKKNFEHLRELIPRLAAYGNRDIILACVVQSENYCDLPRIAELAKQWGVEVNFSIYNHLRTSNRELSINCGGQPNCQAGRRFLVINPWAKLAPCGMFQERFTTQKEMIEKFTKLNECSACYTSSRANSEKSPWRMLIDAMRIAGHN